ncbi:MAG: hypothetical protein AB9921_09895 [Erysipelotrichaceae bacterium]|jgi:hypothetical protein
MSSTLLLFVAVAAGIAAIIKLLSAGRGRVSIPGISISWSD